MSATAPFVITDRCEYQNLKSITNQVRPCELTLSEPQSDKDMRVCSVRSVSGKCLREAKRRVENHTISELIRPSKSGMIREVGVVGSLTIKHANMPR